MRAFTVILSILLVLLQIRLWGGKASVGELEQLRQQVDKQQKSNLVLEKRNQLLREEIGDLKSGMDAIEERARNELGMIRSNEVFFRINNAKDHP